MQYDQDSRHLLQRAQTCEIVCVWGERGGENFLWGRNASKAKEENRDLPFLLILLTSFDLLPIHHRLNLRTTYAQHT